MSYATQAAAAILTQLSADTALANQLTTYDGEPAVLFHVPQELNTYPYVVLYDLELLTNDTMASEYFEGTFNIHSWSDQPDLAIIGDIQKAVYDVLHKQSLTMDDYLTTEMHQEFSTILRDPDGITIHGVQRFRLIIQTNIG